MDIIFSKASRARCTVGEISDAMEKVNLSSLYLKLSRWRNFEQLLFCYVLRMSCTVSCIIRNLMWCFFFISIYLMVISDMLSSFHLCLTKPGSSFIKFGKKYICFVCCWVFGLISDCVVLLVIIVSSHRVQAITQWCFKQEAAGLYIALRCPTPLYNYRFSVNEAQQILKNL